MVLLLIGCSPSWFDGGQSGNEDTLVPPVCTETERVEIARDSVADGFAYAPATLIDSSSGAWSGWFRFDDTDASNVADAFLSLDYASAEPEVVRSKLVGTVEGPDGTYIDVNEESSDCPPRYELHPATEFRGGQGAFEETFHLEVRATPEFNTRFSNASLDGEVALVDFHGTVRPSWDTDAWRETTFGLWATLDETGTLYGATTWASSGPADDDSSGDSRQENIGGFSLSRLP